MPHSVPPSSRPNPLLKRVVNTAVSPLHNLIRSQTGGGIVLAIATLLALVLSNSEWKESYQHFVHLHGEIKMGENGEVFHLSKTLLHWVNDLWMAIFFFLVGLEIKREMLEGELASFKQALLPIGAAVGGMVVPALIYATINWGDAQAMRGWAIPSATDIAFALGILLLLGDRVPPALKVFLAAVAIIDDLGAIIIIAAFYTSQLDLFMLGSAGLCALFMLLLNRAQVKQAIFYIAVGVFMWYFVYKSGIHATLAGVITAMAIPLRADDGSSPLIELEHELQAWVTFIVLPVFAFANAGVDLSGVTSDILFENITMGIIGGLVFGKIIGVALAAWLVVKVFGARLPHGSTWPQFFGVAMLCGIGFTMSLFIGSLAFAVPGGLPMFETELKLGVLCASVVSAVVGVVILLVTTSSGAANTTAKRKQEGKVVYLNKEDQAEMPVDATDI